MGASYRVSPRLKQALAKLSALPHHEQDEIAARIGSWIAGDEWTSPIKPTAPGFLASVGDLADKLLPKHPVARSITMVFCSFTLFVQAPIALMWGAADLIREANRQPTGAAEIRQTAAGNATRSIVRDGLPANRQGIEPEADAIR